MKIFKSLSLIAVAVFALTSCIHKGDLGCDPVPDISFDYTCDGLTLTFTSTTPGTTNVSWEVVGQTQGTGDSFTYSFPTPGQYWIKMTGTYEGKEQTFAGKILVAKPSPVKLDDNSFADWDEVTYEDFQLTLEYRNDYAALPNHSYGKFDYDANNIYFFFAIDDNLPKAGPGEAILNIRLDADDLTGTGMSSKSLGCDWYLEGAVWEPGGWISMYDCATGDTVECDKTLTVGTCKQENGMMYFEFAFNRKEYGINGSTIGVFAKFYHMDWDDAIYVYNYEGKTTFHLSLDKLN